MSYLRKSSFTNSLKGKVIIAFSIGFIAFILAWTVSKVAFKKMLTTVVTIAAPDKKLLIVNQLFRDITKLDQFQRSQNMQKTPVSYKSFIRESDSIRWKMNILKKLYRHQKFQIGQVDKMQDLLKKRDSLFLSYLRVREGLINDRVFSSQINSLTGLINRSSSEMDSTIVKTEQTQSTTTTPSEKVVRDRGFFNRLFGKKKGNTVSPEIKKEINITIDTVARANTDSVIQEMEDAVKGLAIRQKQRSNRFINQEIELANAGNILINQILDVLQQVEKDVLKQVEVNTSKARGVVNHSADRIQLIMLTFMFITAFLAYLILTDISRSNTYREELEAARDEAEYHGQAKQRFLSSMSHEIRTPLQSIIGYAEQLKDQEKIDKKNVDAIYGSSIHLLHIVNEVLDYSRIVSGKFKFTRSLFDVSGVMEEVVTIMTPQAEKKSLGLRFNNLITGSSLLIGDPFRLKQILFNLIGNAIKFTESGEIIVNVKSRIIKRKSYLTIEVIDSGAGISEEDLLRIFAEFEQAGNNAFSNENGTGLGLSIVKALVEGQGGRIEVQSKPAIGTCFTLHLKYTVPRENMKIIKALPESTEGFPGLVWLVDDDAFILQLCCTLLDKHGIRYKSFNLPSLMLAESVPDDLEMIMMDIRMPEMTGLELCRRMREILPAAVKIIALTAQALPEERVSILNQGFDALLMKPFKESDLVDVLYSQPVAKVDVSLVIPHEGLDLTAIGKMAMGDESVVKKILERFCDDSRDDVKELKASVESKENETVALLLHRIAGRTAQVGAKDLGRKFREEELLLYAHPVVEDAQKERINGLIDELEQLTTEVYSI
ncbi:hybrid sensor histidine kinase/response regulator [Arcticibacter eurypsychrophilus]|uniref:hybrid sensor histidine kinase/response regulator n=1 Tax=Arcticibacter eurypsychrophilus TaxID=1434752 RepID=UPI00084CF23F|nr:ATP-binding protein [Arcticibacter eurypsychrophilus]